MSTTMRSANGVVGVDSFAGAVDLAGGIRDSVLTDGLADRVVSADGRVDVVVETRTGWGSRATSSGLAAGAGGLQADVGLGAHSGHDCNKSCNERGLHNHG